MLLFFFLGIIVAIFGNFAYWRQQVPPFERKERPYRSREAALFGDFLLDRFTTIGADGSEPYGGTGLPVVRVFLTPGNYANLTSFDGRDGGIFAKAIFALDSGPAMNVRIRLGDQALTPSAPYQGRYVIRVSASTHYPFETLTLVRPESLTASIEILQKSRLAASAGLMTTLVGYVELVFNGKPMGLYLALLGPDEFWVRGRERMPGDIYAPLRSDSKQVLDYRSWEKRAVYNRYGRNDYTLLRRLIAAPDRAIDLDRIAAYLALGEIFPPARIETVPRPPVFFIDPTSGLAEPILFTEPFVADFKDEVSLFSRVAPLLAPLLNNETVRRKTLEGIRRMLEPDTFLADFDRALRADARRIRRALEPEPSKVYFDGRQYTYYTISQFDRGLEELVELMGRHRARLLEQTRLELDLLPAVSGAAGKVIALEGVVRLETNLIVRRGDTLVIRPGADVRMESGVSIVSYGRIRAEGSSAAPIRIRPAREGVIWGALVLQGRGASGSRLQRVHVEGGSEAEWAGVYYSGSVSIHNADVEFERCEFRDNQIADDLVNAKHSRIRIVDSLFERALMDALDLDYSDGLIARNIIRDAGNDGFDLMSSRGVVISENRLLRIGDKAFSVGEGSAPRIERNIVDEAVIGVASKDGSNPTVTDNIFIRCATAVAIYPKNPRYVAEAGGIFLRNVFRHCGVVRAIAEGAANYRWEDNIEQSVTQALHADTSPSYAGPW